MALIFITVFAWLQPFPGSVNYGIKATLGSFFSFHKMIGLFHAGESAELSEPVVCVCPTAMNVLYTGINNPVNFAVSGVPAGDVEIRIDESKGRIDQKGDEYFAVVFKPGDVSIHVKFKHEGKVAEREVKFRAMPFPEPELLWGDEHVVTEVVKSNEALASEQRLVMSYGRGYAFDREVPTVRSYQFIYQPHTGPALLQRVSSDTIPDDIREKIQDAQSADRIIVDMIRISGPDGDKPLAPFLVELKRVGS